MVNGSEFCVLVNKHKCVLEPSEAKPLFYNIMAEKCHHTYSEMIMTMLVTSGFVIIYWSYAILHAARFKI